MSDSEHDDEFEAYLKRRVPINKGATPPDRLEPPAELDRIVIGKARRAIQGAAPVHVYRAPKWALPVGLAATIILSFVLVLELGLRAKRQNEAAENAPEPGGAEVLAQRVPDAGTLVPTSPAIPQTPEGVGNSTSADQSRSAKSRIAKPRPSAAATAKVAEHIKLPPIPTVPWPPAATANTATAADGADRTADDKARTRLARAEVAASRSRTDVGLASGSTLEEIVVTGPPSRQPANERSGRADPAAWLSQIEKLRNEGHTAQAEQEIKHFREVFPAYPVPAQAASADDRGQ